MSAVSETKNLNFHKVPIRDLGLQIEGTRLEPLVEQLHQELVAAGITALKPHFYLSTDWGVPFPSISIGIPFYLARPELLAIHADLVGHVEGLHEADILRYFRHETGHVLNYGYKLYEGPEWVGHFGSMTQPYVEDYRPEPFSTRYVQHLPGWYAQKHPDEDWAETFAVWLTPGANWRATYADWPVASEKLQFCEATIRRIGSQPPIIDNLDVDDRADTLPQSVEEYYHATALAPEKLPAGLDGALRTMFDDFATLPPNIQARPASELMRRLERPLMASVFRWTGHFPERTRDLLRYLANRADRLRQVYDPSRETDVALEISVLITSLAATYVRKGSYLA
jgi:hypothetical protein